MEGRAGGCTQSATGIRGCADVSRTRRTRAQTRAQIRTKNPNLRPLRHGNTIAAKKHLLQEACYMLALPAQACPLRRCTAYVREWHKPLHVQHSTSCSWKS
eukprot:scaffold672_cov268-Pinguiococcus_pyrenoidosus.AAC.13